MLVKLLKFKGWFRRHPN